MGNTPLTIVNITTSGGGLSIQINPDVTGTPNIFSNPETGLGALITINGYLTVVPYDVGAGIFGWLITSFR